MEKTYRPSAREMHLIKIEKKVENKLLKKGMMGWELRNPRDLIVESKNNQKLHFDIDALLEVSRKNQLESLVLSLEKIQGLSEVIGIGPGYCGHYEYLVEFYLDSEKTTVKTIFNRRKNSAYVNGWIERFCICLEKMGNTAEASEIKMTSIFSEEETILKANVVKESFLLLVKEEIRLLGNHLQEYLVQLKKESQMELEKYNQKWSDSIKN